MVFTRSKTPNIPEYWVEWNKLALRALNVSVRRVDGIRVR